VRGLQPDHDGSDTYSEFANPGSADNSAWRQTAPPRSPSGARYLHIIRKNVQFWAVLPWGTSRTIKVCRRCRSLLESRCYRWKRPV